MPKLKKPETVKPRLDRLIPLGRTAMTRGVADLVESENLDLLPYFARHASCDWGDICAEDWQSNNHAVEHGHRLLSVYKLSDTQAFWIITEWDRSVTTALLPSEY